ncbi:MAG: hypothetical protein ACRDTT_00515, partial [Pseudonocardiaceae bacterium]
MAGQTGSGTESEYLFVGDWCVTVGPYGVEVTEAAAASRGLPLRPRPPGQFLPEPFPDLLGRQNEAEIALETLREQAFLEIYGEAG